MWEQDSLHPKDLLPSNDLACNPTQPAPPGLPSLPTSPTCLPALPNLPASSCKITSDWWGYMLAFGDILRGYIGY